jgi:ribose transport system ATP-binding protein
MVSAEAMERMSVRASSDGQSISELSGGNQQKVVLGRWLATEPCILLLDEPTRGIDVGAKAEIHTLIRNLAASGVSVLLASSELNEIRIVSDRVCVMCEGRITADLSISEADEQTMLRHALPQKQSI